MRKSNFALRLLPSLMEALKKTTAEEQTTLNQYINVAVAEKLAARQVAKELFAERAKKGKVRKALRLLDSLGNEEPQSGDER